MIGAVQRTIKGIEVSDESLSLETIRKVCLEGPGHYLGSDQTLQLMQREYIYPSVGDRTSPNQWVEQGRPIGRRARGAQSSSRFSRATTRPHIPDSVDAAIRERLPIRLAARGDAADGGRGGLRGVRAARRSRRPLCEELRHGL